MEANQIQFPLKTDLRIILDQTLPSNEARKTILNLCERLAIPVVWVGEHLSKQGSYTSYIIQVEFDCHEVMISLYNDLKTIPGIKTVI